MAQSAPRLLPMVDYLAVSEATGRGQRIRKPRMIFEGVAASSRGKRKRAAIKENAPTATTASPSKKQVMTRDISVISVGAAPAAGNNNRKRAADDDEVAATAPPPTKKRATSRAASTVPLPSPPPKKGAIRRAPPHMTTRATSHAASAPPAAAPPPDFTAPVKTKRGQARKDQSAVTTDSAPAPVKAPATATRKGKGMGKSKKVAVEVTAEAADSETEAVKEDKGKGGETALDPVQEEAEEEVATRSSGDFLMILMICTMLPIANSPLSLPPGVFFLLLSLFLGD